MAGLTSGFTPPRPAHAAPCAGPGQDHPSIPWASQLLAPGRAWPATRGEGITIAVLSSGVDAGHPRLAGRVKSGANTSSGPSAGSGNTDCLGTGTQVAGVIAASPADGSGFAGVAPEALILPIRVVDDRAGTQPQVVASALARGIAAAVTARAQVIVVPSPAYTDDPALRSAVETAWANRVVVVSAIGDLGGGNAGNPPSYPASYDGVIGVGAIDEVGLRLESSQHGQGVDLVAPGGNVVTLQRGGGLVPVTGTGVAAGFVAGAAALVRARQPDWTPAQVARQLAGTATPAAGAAGSQEYGRGVVNPVAAVNEVLVSGAPVPPAPVVPEEGAPVDRWAGNRRVATVGTVGVIAAALLVLAIAAVLPRALRRRFRAGMTVPPKQRFEPLEPPPPAQLFDEPVSR